MTIKYEIIISKITFTIRLKKISLYKQLLKLTVVQRIMFTGLN